MKKANNQWKRSTSVVMAAMLACSGIQIPVQAKETESWLLGNAETAAAIPEAEVKTAEAELSQEDTGRPSKEETVYVIADADGSPQKLIVSDWLKNAMGSQSLEDTTELTNITNVKGSEGFRQKEGALGVWDAAGNDIYYQGNIQKELPVDLKVSYSLNGRAVSPQELSGQSGKVSIRFDYTNRQKEKVFTDGREEELYVPFVVITGVVLDNEKFKNIEAVNGKIINDGERTLVMGYAMPGLKDNLDIGSEEFDIEELDIPDYVELTADVTDFELAATMTVAANEIFSDMELDTQEKMDELTADMDELQDAMEKLMDGTSDLYDGVLELKDGTDELYDGMEELNDGARELRDGASSLKSGAGELVKGVNQLADGLSELASKNEELLGGAEQVFNSLLGAANTQLKQLQAAIPGMTIPTLTIQNYASVLDGLIAQIDGMLKQPGTIGLDTAQISLPTECVEMIQEENVPDETVPETAKDEWVKDTPGTEEEPRQEEETQEEIQKDKLEENVKEEPEKENTEEQKQEEEVEGEPVQKEESGQRENLEQEAQMTQAVVQEKEYVPVQTSGASTASPAAGDPAAALAAARASLAALKAQLDGYSQFYQGLQAYTAGVAQTNQGAQALLEGAKKLSSGAGELQDGTIKLKDGTHELKDGGQDLRNGVEELRDGSGELRDGTVEFNDEGIQKLVDLFEGDVQELSDRMDAVKSAARSYQSFAGIPDGVEGTVRFVYKTQGIKK